MSLSQSLGMSLQTTNLIVSVVVANRRISCPNKFCHLSRCLGSLRRCLYSISSPVSKPITALAQSVMNCCVYLLDAVFFAVMLVVMPGNSIALYRNSSVIDRVSLLSTSCDERVAVGLSSSSCVMTGTLLRCPLSRSFISSSVSNVVVFIAVGTL